MNKIQPKTLFVGKNQVYLPTCHSTNDVAAEIIQKQGLINGTVIITDHQTAGKGQRGNKWDSNTGENILLSFIIDTHTINLTKQFLLSMAVSNAIYNTLVPFFESSLKIKWPNDIYINQKKVAGVLIESVINGDTLNHSIIGIGINVYQNLFSNSNATSLYLQKPHYQFSMSNIIENLCANLEEQLYLLEKKDWVKIKSDYLENLFWNKEKKHFRDKNGDFLGEIIGVEDNGYLEIMTFSEKKYYDIKEIQFLLDV